MLFKIHKIKKYYIVLFIAMIIDLGFFDLVNTSAINIMGIHYSDIIFLFCMSIILWEIVKSNFKLRKFKELFLIGILMLTAMLSSYSAEISYHQGLLSGIFAQREWLSWILMLYAIYKWYDEKKITKDGLDTCVLCICRIYAIVCILQYFLYDYVRFTYTIVGDRYGSVRLYFNSAFFAYASGIILDKLFDEKFSLKKKIYALLELIIYLFIIAFITKGRMATIALLGSIALCVCLRKNMTLGKKMFFILIVLISIVVFSSTTMGQDIFATIIGDSADTDTLSVRTAGRAYYIAKTFSSVRTAIFGYGVPNIHNNFAMQIANPLWKVQGTARFYLDDVGIIGILFKYGLFGVGVLLSITFICLVKAYKIYSRTHKMVYLQFILMDIITWSSLTPTLFSTSILMMIIITSIFYMDTGDKS